MEIKIGSDSPVFHILPVIMIALKGEVFDRTSISFGWLIYYIQFEFGGTE